MYQKTAHTACPACASSDYGKYARIFVTGFIGSDRKKEALKIASETGYTHFDVDAMIEQKENMTIQKLCAIRGEHEYRNKEVETLKALSEKENIVVSCGDSIILDEDSFNILQKNKVIFLEGTPEHLWENAKNDAAQPHAFLFSGDENTRYKKFTELYETRKPLYKLLAKEQCYCSPN